jgi:putative nucleotidyltransferase with HDIG domain|tara:strand:+ start:2265 stop:2759 length:495 start_codon:yes stop_codon:yes gene_type:complete
MKKDIPSREECIKILKENSVPDNIIAHCKKVCEVAMKVCDILEGRGVKVDRELVEVAALLHDVEKLKKDHIVAGHDFLTKLGYPRVAKVVLKHGLEHIRETKFSPTNVEDKIVFYSDKRVLNDKVVSLDKRFNYIHKRYGFEVIDNLKFTKKMENELLEEEVIE